MLVQFFLWAVFKLIRDYCTFFADDGLGRLPLSTFVQHAVCGYAGTLDTVHMPQSHC